MDKIKMGNYLTELRKKKELSQANLADLIGVTFQAVSKWERGEAVPDIAILEQLSILYGVTIDEIIKGEKQEIEIKVSEQKPNSFLRQKRIYGFWISIAYLVLLFLFAFLPFVRLSNGISGNYYQTIFSNYYLIGNYLLLFQFFLILSVPLITMSFCICQNQEVMKKLYLIRFILSIALLVSLLVNLFYIMQMAVGGIFIIVLTLTYSILCLTIKKLKKPYIFQDFLDSQE